MIGIMDRESRPASLRRENVPTNSNNKFNPLKSRDLVSAFEGSFPQTRIVRKAGQGLEFEGSLLQDRIVRG